MKKILLFAILAFSLAPSYSQTIKISAEKITGELSPSAFGGTFDGYGIYKIDIEKLNAEVETAGPVVDLVLRFGDQYFWHLELTESDIRSPGYRLRIGTPSGVVEAPKTPIYTYQGNLKGGKNVALTIADNFFYGIVKSKSESYLIEPAHFFDKDAPEGYFILYKASDVKPDPEASCAFTENRAALGRLPAGGKRTGRHVQTDRNCHRFRFPFVQRSGQHCSGGGKECRDNEQCCRQLPPRVYR